MRPGTDAWVLLAMVHVLFADGVATAPAHVPRDRRRRGRGRGLHPRAGGGDERRARRRRTPPGARVRRGRERRGLRARGGVHAGVRHGVPVGGHAAQRPHRQPGPGGRRDVHQPGDRRRRARHHRPWPPRRLAVSGSGDCRRRAASSRSPRCARRSRRRARARSARCSPSPATRCSPPRTALASTRRLAGLDFMAAVDIYINETTRHADVMLPPTTALERDHYDLVFHTLAVRNTARFTPAVLPAGPGSPARLADLPRAGRCARSPGSDRRPTRRERLALRARIEHQPDPAGPAAAPEPAAPASPCAGSAPRPRASTSARCDPGCCPAPPDPRPPHRPGAPARPGRPRPRLATAPEPAAGELLLIGRRHQQDCNAWMHNVERLTRGRPRHQLLMHPDDLAARSLVDGATVRVSSRVGTVDVEVAATDDVMPGVVSLPHGYGHARNTRDAPRRPGPGRLDQRPHRPRAAGRVAATPRSAAYR